MEKALLIFPAGMPRALGFLEQCLREKRRVIGASSLAHDPSRPQYPEWQHLPYVTDTSFDAALSEAVKSQHITSIYTANPVVWDYLNRRLAIIAPGVNLANDAPAASDLQGFRAARLRAAELLAKPLPLADVLAAKPDLSEIQITSLFAHVDTIPGMCDHQKLRALYEIVRHSPVGDLVEIGSWWGKSAFALLRLAQCFQLGALLCVDPWSDAHLVQKDASGLVDSVSAQVSADEAFQVFLSNLLPYAANNLNYLRMPSTAGAALYRQQTTITSPEFGVVAYQGKIAVLHIDGNHSYENAQADMNAWAKLVSPGGWIVVDDYTWPFGDGPRRAADDYLESNQTRIATAFFMGGALFIQKL